MNTSKRFNVPFLAVTFGALVFASFIFLTRTPAQAAGISVGTPPQKPTGEGIVSPTLSITDTVIARVDNLIAPAGKAPASGQLPPGTSLSAVAVAGRVVTVVLNLPAAVLFNPTNVVDSDGVNRAVVQSLYGLPISVFHVYTTDPRDPSATPRPVSAYVRLRPMQYKTGVITPTVPHVAGQSVRLPEAGPTYALSGKSVYVSAGHGWYYNPYIPGWTTQRGSYQNIIEDMNNAEAVDQYLINYLRQAGADVFPVRDPTLNTSEIVIDVGTSGYEQYGSWTVSSYTGYQGHHYRYALTVASGQATAVVTWTANIAVSGWYPVYAWYVAGTNRPTDAHYEIDHPLGMHITIVDQTRHGQTWRYLGTFYFRAGDVARVRLLNTSSVSGNAVIADAVRFGGGIGDYNSGGGASNKPRWEEAARYYTYLLGAPASVYDPYGGASCGGLPPDECDDVTARPRYADWENTGTGDDAVYVSWHTNGYNGTARGTVSYVYDNSEVPTYTLVPGSTALQAAVHSRVVQAIQTGWDPSWPDLGMDQADFGELRLAQTMPSMLIEMGFHDNPIDAAALKDPRFEQLLARAMYQGIVNYYAQKAGGVAHYVPEPPTQFQMHNAGGGAITFTWQPPPTYAYGSTTDPASSYRLYLSDDGSAWDEGRDVAGNAITLSGFNPNQLVYARVTAVSPGGESFPTPVLAVRIGNSPRVLIVEGFDTIDSSMDIVQTVAGYSGVDRIFVNRMNRQNYIVQHAVVITEPFDSVTHQAIDAGALSLTAYRFIDWFAGLERGSDVAIGPNERQALRSFASVAGNVLFVSGANVAYQLYYSSDPGFLTSVLRSGYYLDNGNSYAVNPIAGGFFAGVGTFGLDDGTHGTYNTLSPDVIYATNGSSAALAYNTGNVAATVYLNHASASVINLAFPFETIYPATAQSALMARALSLLTPVVALSSNSPVPIGSAAVLTADLTGSFTFAWNFGDGTSIINTSMPSVSHQYASKGAYTVWLTATSGVDGSLYFGQTGMIVSSPLTLRVYLPFVVDQAVPVVEARAVWISRFDWCGQPPCSQTMLVNLINHAADAHFNIILFQVRATADAYYTPGLEPWAYLLSSAQTSTLGTNPGWDPLAVAIQVAHSRGMQLHAYVNMYSNWECNKWFPPHTTPEHSFWTLGFYQPNSNSYSPTWRVYSTTTSGPTFMSVLSSAAVPCNEYLWSSPGVDRVNQENLAVVKDIVTRYNVDGIHMDRIRYPGPQYSTDPESLAAWQAVSNTISFADWQRNILSSRVTRIYTEVKAIKPWVKVSAAVWFTYKKTISITFPTSQGYYDYYQDSHDWLTSGSLDAMVPMIYGGVLNSNLTDWEELADDHIAVQGNRQVWLGIGGANTPFSSISDRIAYARSIGAKGVALWSAGALEENNYWVDFLLGPFQSVAAVP